jgi:hypothetical protein
MVAEYLKRGKRCNFSRRIDVDRLEGLFSHRQDGV